MYEVEGGALEQHVSRLTPGWLILLVRLSRPPTLSGPAIERGASERALKRDYGVTGRRRTTGLHFHSGEARSATSQSRSPISTGGNCARGYRAD